MFQARPDTAIIYLNGDALEVVILHSPTSHAVLKAAADHSGCKLEYTGLHNGEGGSFDPYLVYHPTEGRKGVEKFINELPPSHVVIVYR
jgi:hypothetical protein